MSIEKLNYYDITYKEGLNLKTTHPLNLYTQKQIETRVRLLKYSGKTDISYKIRSTAKVFEILEDFKLMESGVLIEHEFLNLHPNRLIKN